MKQTIVVLTFIFLLSLILTISTAANSKSVEEDQILLWTEFERSPTIYDIAVGSDYVWGAYPEGVIRWHKQNQTYKIFTQTDGLIDSYVTAVEIDHDDNVWFGTQSGLSRYDGNNWSHFTVSNGLVDNYVTSLSIGPNGELLVGTADGLSVYDGSSWVSYVTDPLADPADCLSYNISDAAIDASGTIWVSTKSAPACYFDGISWRTLFHEGESISANQIEFNENGDLWFAGVYHQNKQGIMLLEAGGTWHHFTEADGLLDDETTSVAIDQNGEIWIGVNGFSKTGISHFDGVTWTSYSKSDGYYGNGVHDIKADDAGVIWTGNNSNVSRFHDSTWQA